MAAKLAREQRAAFAAVIEGLEGGRRISRRRSVVVIGTLSAALWLVVLVPVVFALAGR